VGTAAGWTELRRVRYACHKRERRQVKPKWKHSVKQTEGDTPSLKQGGKHGRRESNMTRRERVKHGKRTGRERNVTKALCSFFGQGWIGFWIPYISHHSILLKKMEIPSCIECKHVFCE
ncbi:hypothetical protein SKAU_G00118060, partial [Synaphobranchus kaupii]